MTLLNAAEAHRELERKYGTIARKAAAAAKTEACEDPKKGVEAMVRAIKDISDSTMSFL